MPRQRPITSSLPEDQQKLAAAIEESMRRHWAKEWGPTIALLVGLVTLVAVLKGWGDELWMPRATAEQKHTSIAVEAKDARQVLKDNFDKRQNAVQRSLDSEITARRLADKDTETNTAAIKELKWRMNRDRSR